MDATGEEDLEIHLLSMIPGVVNRDHIPADGLHDGIDRLRLGVVVIDGVGFRGFPGVPLAVLVVEPGLPSR